MRSEEKETVLTILTSARKLYIDLNLKLRELIENFYRKKMDKISRKDELLSLAQKTYVAIAKLQHKTEKLHIKEDYLPVYTALEHALFHFKIATLFLVEGIRRLSQAFLNRAGEHAQEAIRLSKKVRELYAQTLIENNKSSKVKVCPECGGKWRRAVEGLQIIGGCEICGYSEVEDELPFSPSGMKDNWDGIIDNVERILETNVSKRGWMF